jgi:hypothetical protein
MQTQEILDEKQILNYYMMSTCWGCLTENTLLYHPICDKHGCCPACFVAYYRTIEFDVEGNLHDFDNCNLDVLPKSCPICRQYTKNPNIQKFVESSSVLFYPTIDTPKIRQTSRATRAFNARKDEPITKQMLLDNQYVTTLENMSDIQLQTVFLVLSELHIKDMLRFPELIPQACDHQVSKLRRCDLTYKICFATPLVADNGQGSEYNNSSLSCPFAACDLVSSSLDEWVHHFDNKHKFEFVCSLDGCRRTFRVKDPQDLPMATLVHVCSEVCAGVIQQNSGYSGPRVALNFQNLMNAAFHFT